MTSNGRLLVCISCASGLGIKFKYIQSYIKESSVFHGQII